MDHIWNAIATEKRQYAQSLRCGQRAMLHALEISDALKTEKRKVKGRQKERKTKDKQKERERRKERKKKRKISGPM